MPDLTSYTETDNTTFEATGVGSTLDLSSLTSLGSMTNYWHAEALAGGTVNLSGLTAINQPDAGVQFTADGSGSQLNLSALTSFTGNGGASSLAVTNGATVLASSLTTFNDSGLTVAGGSYTLSALTDVDGSSLSAQSGGSLTLPGLTNAKNTTINASGGATLILPAPTAFTAAGSTLTVSGTGSSAQIGSGVLNPFPTSGSTGTINIPAVPEGMILNLNPNGTFSGGTTFNVGAGAIVNIQSGTYTGGVIFNVGQGAVVDLTGGNTVTYGGTLTGSGAGTVQLSSGNFYPVTGSGNGPANAGVTLNFPGGMFQWTGGGMELSVGNVTNEGTINLSGVNETQIYADGTLYDQGTIIQTGTGDFGLHSDNITPTTLLIETGGSYLLGSDAGINNLFNTNAIVNEGTIRKTGGTGTSTLSVNGSLTNTGTIEADSGTLSLAPTSFAQISAGSLTGGTWNALNGATLEFPAGTNITSNAATIAIGGSEATIAALASLASNTGSLSLTGGAGLTTSGDLGNSGSLTVGAGSTLSIGGRFSQTSAGLLALQIGGTPASGQYGQVVATGTAALGGSLDVSLVNSFKPAAGQIDRVISSASVTGHFASVTGLPSGMTVAQSATALDLEMPGTGADLSVTSVTSPSSAAAGQRITVGWTVNDISTTAAAGSWQDSVYLSPTSAIDGSSILLGTVVHTGGLAAGTSYTGSLAAVVPGLAPGAYQIVVQVDSLYQVADPNRSNNILAAPGPLAVSLPALTLGQTAAGSFTAAQQEDYYQVAVPAGGAVEIAAVSSASSGALAVYVSQGSLPTPYDYQEASAILNQPGQTAVVPQVLTAGTYNILVESVSGAAASASYTLTVTQGNAPTVSFLSPASGGNAGNVTVAIDGTNLAPTDTFSLTNGSTTLTATAIDFVSASQIYATFDLAGAAPGEDILSVQQGSQAVTAPTSFQVVAAQAEPLQLSLNMPQFVRSGRTSTILIDYTNASNNDIVAPLLNVTSTNPNVFFSTPDDPNNYVQTAQLLAVAPNGPAGILMPGESGQLTLTLLSNDTTNGDPVPVEVQQNVAGQTIAWAAEQAALRPASFTTTAWGPIWTNLMATVGTTTDSYNAAMAQAATYLSGLGETSAQVSDVNNLWSFLVAQANAAFPVPTLTSTTDVALPVPGNLALAIRRTFIATIAGRNQPGPFGLGWVTDWQATVSTDGGGNVSIDLGGSLAYFVKQASGDFVDTAGESGTLTASGGISTFTAVSGTQYVFLASGRLNYEQDTNGNRITLGYNTQGQLISLTYSNPSDSSQPTETLSLEYNPQGLVGQVTDGVGDTWSYGYDAAGHLQSVTTPSGLKTSYTYDTGTNPETANALLSITNPDGSQQNYTYDPSTGRLTGTSANGGADPINYTYGGEAQVTASDAAGDQTTTWYNAMGLAARVEGPRGGISTSVYDANGNLLSFTNAAGQTYQYAYDSNGDVTRSVNPLGQTILMTYNTLGLRTSISDAGNNTTQYT
ncbi:MAG: beta strand repeat-containing protein [Isosphaeraceae bacterium]